MAIRKERLADQVRDIISMMLMGGRLSDPRLDGVAITAVKLTADLQLAYVYFRSFAGKTPLEVEKGLESAKGLLRQKLAETLEIRRVPNLKFFFDESIDEGSKIENILTHIKDEQKN